jgi:hypothetical protein
MKENPYKYIATKVTKNLFALKFSLISDSYVNFSVLAYYLLSIVFENIVCYNSFLRRESFLNLSYMEAWRKDSGQAGMTV